MYPSIYFSDHPTSSNKSEVFDLHSTILQVFSYKDSWSESDGWVDQGLVNWSFKSVKVYIAKDNDWADWRDWTFFFIISHMWSMTILT